jgi:hypothetical protein
MPGWIGVPLLIGSFGGLVFLVGQVVVFVVAVVREARNPVPRAWRVPADGGR